MYYITTGKTDAMWVLRHAFTETNRWGQTNRDHHVRNLSTVFNTAVAKAKAWGNDNGVSVTIPDESAVRKITRRTAADVAAQKEQWAQERKARRLESFQNDLNEEGHEKVKAVLEAGKPLGWSSFVDSLMEQYLEAGTLSYRQISSFANAIERHERQQKIDASVTGDLDVVEGRGKVSGVVVSIKQQETHYSYYGEYVTKMLVQDARGFKVWGTKPAKLDAEVGDNVEFTATVSKSKDDAKFGFFKRPTV